MKLFRRNSAAGTAEFDKWIQDHLGLTLSGLGTGVFALLGWLLARVTGSRAGFMLAYGALLALAGAWVLARRKPSLEADRSDLPTRVRNGQFVDVELKLIAQRRLSTVVVEEGMDAALGRPVAVAVSSLAAGGMLEHEYTFVPKLRGVYRVGPLVARWSDPFGLTRKRVTLAEPVDVIVHPVTEEVHDRVLSRAWEDPPVRPPVSKPWPTGFEFYGMRDYVDGDDPRRIVWRATARTLDLESGAGRYLVREAEQGITDRVQIVLDTDRREHSAGNPSETFELAVRAAASLADRHLMDGFSVNIDTNLGRVAADLRTRTARIPMLDTMARAETDQEPLLTAVTRMLQEPRRDTHLVIITPYIDDQVAARMRVMLERGTSMLVVVVVGEDADPMVTRRVASLGCNLIELDVGAPLGAMFERVVHAGERR